MTDSSTADLNARLLARYPRMGFIVIPLTVVLLRLYVDTWRVAIAAVLFGLLLMLEVIRRQRGGLTPTHMLPVLTLMPFTLVLLSGGIRSPVILVFLPVSIISGFVLGRRSLLLVGIILPLIWAMAVFDQSPWRPAGFVPDTLNQSGPLRETLAWAVLLSVAVMGGNALTRRIRQAIQVENQKTLTAQQAATVIMATSTFPLGIIFLWDFHVIPVSSRWPRSTPTPV